MIEQVVIVGLAAWRCASLLVSEDGPYAVFARIRRAVGTEEPGALTGAASLLTCVWCTSVWAAAGLWALWEVWRPEPVVVLAAMSLAPIIERWIHGES